MPALRLRSDVSSDSIALQQRTWILFEQQVRHRFPVVFCDLTAGAGKQGTPVIDAMRVASDEMGESFVQKLPGAVAGRGTKRARDRLRRQLVITAEAQETGDQLAVVLQQIITFRMSDDWPDALAEQQLHRAFD